MGSDIDRKSFDERQRYRGVIQQQGRVVIAADANEGLAIATTSRRLETLDIVGPVGVPTVGTGTPDDGFVVSLGPGNDRDLTVGEGAFYLGGNRLELADDVAYATQPDWLDGPPKVDRAAQRELVVVVAEEQEVGAIEDDALREVALGGPDTTARARLRQRFVRVPTTQVSCATAWAELEALWSKAGQTWNPDTAELTSVATLSARLSTTAAPAKPCEPLAQGGYLGADNQLYRFEIETDGGPGGKPVLLWGRDNASYLYRVEVDPNDTTTLVLKSSPVDDEHHPRKDQVVQVLRAGSLLGNGRYAAASTGFVTTLALAYDPTKKTVKVAGALPAEYLDSKQTPALFLRPWEGALPVTTSATPIVSIGLEVTLGTTAVVPGDHWLVALRPATPNAVYPERYATPQPPDGPRRWAAHLGLVDWTGAGAVTDCRPVFDNLVELTARVEALEAEVEELKKKRGGGCCTIVVTPEDVAGDALQRLLDTFVHAADDDVHARICMMPGRYELTKPLVLRHRRYRHITFDGCGGRVVLAPAKGHRSFPQGLVTLVNASEIAFHHLAFELPTVTVGGDDFKLAALAGRERAKVAIGIYALGVAGLDVHDCEFVLAAADDRDDREDRDGESAHERVLGGAAILAVGASTRHRVTRSRFTPGRVPFAAIPGETLGLPRLVGYRATAASELEGGNLPLARRINGRTLRARVDELLIADCIFEGVFAAVVALADLGRLTLRGNRVTNAGHGVVLQTPAVGDLRLAAELSSALRAGQYERLGSAADPDLWGQAAIARALPVPETSDMEAPWLDVADDGEARAAAAPAVAVHAPTRMEGESSDTPELAVSGGLRELLATVEKAGKQILATWLPPAEGDPEEIVALAPTRFADLARALAALEAAARPKAPASNRVCVVAIHDNEIHVGDGVALEVFDADDAASDAALVSHNLLENDSLYAATASVRFVRRVTVTGNLISNHAGPDTVADRGKNKTLVPCCLVVTGAGSTRHPAVAVTGNVLHGAMRLPARNLPAPFDTWDGLNAKA